MNSMHRLLIPLLFTAQLGAAEPSRNCGCACCTGKEVCCCHAGDAPAEKPAAPKRHPVKGVVVDVLPDLRSLSVKHEAIPGLMPAMTMVFRVDDATLRAAAKGQQVTGEIWEADRAWWFAPAKPPQT